MTTNKPQLHWSGIEMLSRCGEQYQRRYVEKEIIPPGVAIIVGSATHHSIKANLHAKLETGLLLPIEQIKDTARDSLVMAWNAGGVVLNEEEMAEGAAKVKAAAIDKAVRLSTLHASEVAPRLCCTHVERPWVIELTGYPVDLAGQIDQQEPETIRDSKTSGKSPSATVADESDQLTIYAMAVRVLDGIMPSRVALDYLIDNKTPVAKTFESTRTEEDFTPLLNRVEEAVKAMEKGVFVPASASHWICNPKFCGYWSSCRYTRRKQISIAA